MSLAIDRLTIPIRDLPHPLEGTTILQLSDFHFDGMSLSDSLLQTAIARSNALYPDLIVLTGDFITRDLTFLEQLVIALQSLRSRYGVYAILGNHDLYRPGYQEQITERLSIGGIPVLWNAIAYPFGSGLPLVGLADYWSQEFNPAPVLNQLDPTIPRIVLSHNPDSAADLQAWRIDLQLSGHTHGGQIVIPGIGAVAPLFLAGQRYLPKPLRRHLPYGESFTRVVTHWEWVSGLHQVGSNLLYVNRGLGSYFPGRLFCPPEVTLITLTASRETLQPSYAKGAINQHRFNFWQCFRRILD